MGDAEVESSTVAIRTREGKDLGKMTVNDFIQSLKNTN
jgi:threonyl-tRNA synthetase